MATDQLFALTDDVKQFLANPNLAYFVTSKEPGSVCILAPKKALADGETDNLLFAKKIISQLQGKARLIEWLGQENYILAIDHETWNLIRNDVAKNIQPLKKPTELSNLNHDCKIESISP